MKWSMCCVVWDVGCSRYVGEVCELHWYITYFSRWLWYVVSKYILHVWLPCMRAGGRARAHEHSCREVQLSEWMVRSINRVGMNQSESIQQYKISILTPGKNTEKKKTIWSTTVFCLTFYLCMNESILKLLHAIRSCQQFLPNTTSLIETIHQILSCHSTACRTFTPLHPNWPPSQLQWVFSSAQLTAPSNHHLWSSRSMNCTALEQRYSSDLT